MGPIIPTPGDCCENEMRASMWTKGGRCYYVLDQFCCHLLCDFRQVTRPLWISASKSAKQSRCPSSFFPQSNDVRTKRCRLTNVEFMIEVFTSVGLGVPVFGGIPGGVSWGGWSNHL